MELKIPRTPHDLNKFLSDTSNRDRITSLVQFATQALIDPAKNAGNAKLAKDLSTINQLAAQYRAITRISQWLNVGPEMLHPLRTIEAGETKLIGTLKLMSTCLFSVFLLGEEVNLLAKNHVVSPALGKGFNRVRFVFLFWSNIVRATMNLLIYRRSKAGQTKESALAHEKKRMNVFDGVLQLMFVYGLLKGSSPCGVLTLPNAMQKGGALDVVAAIAPPFFPLNTTFHGLLGIVAAMPLLRSSLL